jgi:PIF1-like helicase
MTTVCIQCSLQKVRFNWITVALRTDHVEFAKRASMLSMEAGYRSSLHEELPTESLIAAYHSTALSWHKESLIAAQRIPNILSGTDHARLMQPESLLPLDIFQLPTHASSGLKYFPATTLQQWDSQIKKLAKPDDTDEPVAFDFDDFNLDLGDGILHPILESTDSISNLADRRLQVGENPTGATLINLISEDIPLNHKQRLVVDRILSHALSWSGVAYDASKREHMLLYVGGEGGSGKSQITKAVVAGMNLICRKDEVILMAPTGAAADHIGGNTYHTSLGIGISKTQKSTVPPRIRKLWSNKTIMILDEVSMVDLSSLSTIDNQCKIARSLDRSSTELFGSLPVVILMGDLEC